MTIPINLTCAEVGAFLVAIGQHMVDNDVCAAAVLDPECLKDDEYASELIGNIDDAEWHMGVSCERANELLQLTLEEAINFNPAEIPK
jgi:hypothetical protein